MSGAVGGEAGKGAASAAVGQENVGQEDLLRLLAHGPPPAGHGLALAHISTLHARLKLMREQRPELDDAITNIADLAIETERLHTQAQAWQREFDGLLELPTCHSSAPRPTTRPAAFWEHQLAQAIRSLGAERKRACEAEAALERQVGATHELSKALSEAKLAAATHQRFAAQAELTISQAELTARVHHSSLAASLHALEAETADAKAEAAGARAEVLEAEAEVAGAKAAAEASRQLLAAARELSLEAQVAAEERSAEAEVQAVVHQASLAASLREAEVRRATRSTAVQAAVRTSDQGVHAACAVASAASQAGCARLGGSCDASVEARPAVRDAETCAVAAVASAACQAGSARLGGSCDAAVDARPSVREAGSTAAPAVRDAAALAIAAVASIGSQAEAEQPAAELAAAAMEPSAMEQSAEPAAAATEELAAAAVAARELQAGLEVARAFLEPVKRRFPGISYSDLWILAAYVGIEYTGGPAIEFTPGVTLTLP